MVPVEGKVGAVRDGEAIGGGGEMGVVDEREGKEDVKEEGVLMIIQLAK